MNALRRKSEPGVHGPEPEDCDINYSKQVTKEQIEKLDEMVKAEFATGEWVTVAGEA